MDSNARPVEADRSVPELLQKLADETTTLVRQELELARAELGRTLVRARESAAPFGICAIFALGAFGALTATLIAALAIVIPVWAAALVVTVIYGIVAAIGAQTGRASLKKVGSPLPAETIRTVKDDAATVHSAVRRGR
jgi:uncharacterized membrane protein YqjE